MKMNVTFGQPLSREELKKIVGGGCAYVKKWDDEKEEPKCAADAGDAESSAGGDGFWCCNCKESEGC